MGGFIAVVLASGRTPVAAEVFGAATAAHEKLLRQVPSATVRQDWVRAASFRRVNGSGSVLATDESGTQWVIAVGTWFHPHGYRSGQELRLLRRYREVGARELGRELEGFFCLVFGDARTRELVVVTDLIGSCHAFLSKTDDAVVVSTSSLALASVVGPELDLIGCQEFLASGIVYEDRTCFRKVRKLGPARVVRIGASGIASEEHYWDVRQIADDSPLLGDDAVVQLWEAMTRAARHVGSSFPRPVCDLTGGYDSRAMLAAFLGAGVRVSVTVSGAPNSRDVVVSKGIAAKLGLEHVHCDGRGPLDSERLDAALRLTDGECDLVEYARVLDIHDQLRAKFDISINGSFGEVARGYWWELLFPHIGSRVPLNHDSLARARFATGTYDPTLVPAPLRLDLAEHFAGVIRRANQGLGTSANTLQMDNTYLSLRMQRWQGRIASSTNRLWPCVSPFMFRSVLETMLKVAPRQRLRSLLVRQVLKRFQPALAAYPLEHGYPAEPATWRNLARFAPIVSYYGRRIGSKLVRMSGVPAARNVRESAHPRLFLWQDEPIRALFDPARMRTSESMDADRIRGFLARSQEREFAFDGQWSRLLSLEMALRAVGEVAGGRPRDHNAASDALGQPLVEKR